MAVSIDAQAAINEIAAELGVGDADVISNAVSSSKAFGDQEFLHEIGMYGLADTTLLAGFRAQGALGNIVPEWEMDKPGTRGESLTELPAMPQTLKDILPAGWVKEPYIKINKDELDLPPAWPHREDSTTGQMYLAKDREYLNDLWRHEFRHHGTDALREKSDRSLFHKTKDFLGQTYTAPLDFELEDIFSPGWDNKLSNVFGITGSTKYNNEEAFLRVLDIIHGKSETYPEQAKSYLDSMARNRLIDPPSSWADKFIVGDTNSILHKIQVLLEANP